MTSGELMDTAKEPFDFRLSEYARVTDALTHPQPYLAEKVATTRFERIEEGVVYLYRHEDIIKVNRDPGFSESAGGAAHSERPPR